MALIHQLTTLFAWLLWIGAILSLLAYGLETDDISNVSLFKQSINLIKFIALPWYCFDCRQLYDSSCHLFPKCEI